MHVITPRRNRQGKARPVREHLWIIDNESLNTHYKLIPRQDTARGRLRSRPAWRRSLSGNGPRESSATEKNDVKATQQTEKPILVTRFTKKSEEWLNATHYNARTGKIPRVSAFSSLPPNPECNNTRIFVVNKNVHEVTLGNRASSPRFRVRQKQSFAASKRTANSTRTPFVPLFSNFRDSTEAAHRLDVEAKEHRLNRQIVDLFAPFCQRI